MIWNQIRFVWKMNKAYEDIFVWNYNQTSRVSGSDSISQLHYSTSIYIPSSPLKHQQQLSTPTGMFVDKDGLIKIHHVKMTAGLLELCFSPYSRPRCIRTHSHSAVFLSFHGILIKVNKLSRRLHMYVASTDTCCSK